MRITYRITTTPAPLMDGDKQMEMLQALLKQLPHGIEIAEVARTYYHANDKCTGHPFAYPPSMCEV